MQNPAPTPGLALPAGAAWCRRLPGCGLASATEGHALLWPRQSSCSGGHICGRDKSLAVPIWGAR
eukprot:6431458-Prorocentrum_lima.AAC.1